VGGIVVEDGVNGLAGKNLALDGVEKTDELLMPVTLHAATDHRPVEDVHGCEQGGPPMAPARPFFIGKPGWVRLSAWIWLFSST
jgi:hypothetical protein